MNIFRRPDYKSDTTQFLEQLLTLKPALEVEPPVRRCAKLHSQNCGVRHTSPQWHRHAHPLQWCTSPPVSL